MLDHSEVARYLLLHKLISAEALVDGDLRIAECSRRNHNLKVIQERGTSYFLKLGVGPNKSATLAHEAAVYELLEGLPEGNKLTPYLPRYFRFDEAERLLIIELLNRAQDFRQYHTRGRFSTVFASELGRALSSLHTTPNPAPGTSADSRLTARVPWVLGLHRPGISIFEDASNANLQLIRIIQNSEDFGRMLDELRRGWRVDGLVHNDIKWDNCLVVPRSAPGKRPDIRIVDWEFAGTGDQCWDAGSVFSNYLSFWLLSIPISGDAPPDQFLELARYQLETMQPALRAYWRAYVRGLGLNQAAACEWLIRAVRYAGARLIQTGFEQMQFSTRLAGNVVCMLQLSLNIIKRPQEAAVHLLGISGAL
jgi:hypothetical protein